MKTLLPEIDSADKRFHNGNPAAGEQGTRVTDTWLNDVQDRVRDMQSEAHYVLLKAGFTPKQEQQTQLYQAIVKIIDDNRKEASTTQKGEVQLYSGYDSDSEELAATPKVIKTIKGFIDSVTRSLTNYIPNSKKSSAVNSNSADTVATSAAVKAANDNANDRVAKSGDTMTGNLTVPNIIVNDPTNNNNSVQIGDDTKLIDVDMGHTVGLQTTDNANDAYIAYGATKKRFGFDGVNFSAESGLGAQWFESQKQGEGAYVVQYNSLAPYYVDVGNAMGANIYYPFIKGKVANGHIYGESFSFGYVTPGVINQFGSGVINLTDDVQGNKQWHFQHDGIFRSAGDVISASGISLDALYNNLNTYSNKLNELINGFTATWYGSHYQGAEVYKIKQGRLMIIRMNIGVINQSGNYYLPESFDGGATAIAIDSGGGQNNVGAIFAGGNVVYIGINKGTNVSVIVIGVKN